MLNIFFLMTQFLKEKTFIHMSMYLQTTIQVAFKDITILLGNK